ncbi:hypothetical protein Y032_0035g3083 [Ancylostoma ceylanicum]|uniref:Uncharacterized protein n=1 Tax=Ancylostoma ceylanicum TaxID=53326 RepID=A0A016ULA0_9BILA|nr:hypothetical protein Y032_0035g3083 [Ancylostoma ceylanicum]
MPLQVLRLAFGESRNSRLHPLLLKTKGASVPNSREAGKCETRRRRVGALITLGKRADAPKLALCLYGVFLARIMETRSKKTILKSERTFEKKKGKNDENKSVVFAKNLPRRYSAATRATRSAGESFCVIAKSPKPTKYSLRSTIH